MGREAFKKVKNKIKKPLLLIHYDPRKSLELVCDASPYGVGAVLSQVSSDGTEQPVSFASRALSKVEQRYSQLDKEALAIIYGVKKFHQYLLGRRFTIVSDHKPLMYLLGEHKPIPKIVSARVQRWALLLGAYSYALKYRPGSAVSNADALSRLPVSEAPNNIPVPPDIILNMDMLNQTPITADVIRTMSSKDPLISKIIYYVDHGWPWMVDAELRPRKEELTTAQGCLLLGSRIVIPTKGQDAILQELHQTHPGIARMKALARQYVWWPKMDCDIEKYVKTCETCQYHRAMPPVAAVHPWEFPSGPWRKLHVDHAGPFLGKVFLVVIDSYSKWIEVASTSTECTIKVLKKLFATHGLPETLVTDNGTSFTSVQFKKFCEYNGIIHIRTPPYHPKSNGMAERTFKETLRRTKEVPIHTSLAQFLFRYRLTPQTTTGTAPCKLLFGRIIRSRLDLMQPNLRHTVQRLNKISKRATMTNRQDAEF